MLAEIPPQLFELLRFKARTQTHRKTDLVAWPVW